MVVWLTTINSNSALYGKLANKYMLSSGTIEIWTQSGTFLFEKKQAYKLDIMMINYELLRLALKIPRLSKWKKIRKEKHNLKIRLLYDIISSLLNVFLNSLLKFFVVFLFFLLCTVLSSLRIHRYIAAMFQY